MQQTTQGLIRYLQQHEPHRLQSGGVAIGYDGRHQSQQFALIAAAVCISQGVRAWLFSELVPTPFVPAAVQQLVSWWSNLFVEACQAARHGFQIVRDMREGCLHVKEGGRQEGGC